MNESIHGEKTAPELQDELTEVARHRAAISEVLRAIASSSHDLQPIFDTIIDSATRLCQAEATKCPQSAHHREEGMQTMTIARRFRGPPNSGNGGYVCGMLARHIPGTAEVALRAPLPLDTELDIVEVQAGRWELRQGTATLPPPPLFDPEQTLVGLKCQCGGLSLV